ncbi:MAG: peptidoglycan binding protein CsiV [Gammaproteobacteria bacterium]|nr:peptidoglycan binding protein CsiV [Gammaproteobacteria bacterium]
MCSTAQAQNNLYQVNIIVFRHITNEALTSEQWPNQLITPDLRNALDLKPLDQTILNDEQNLFGVDRYQALPDNQIGLKKEIYRLSRHSDYQILLKTSWVQPITSIRYARWVHVHGGQTYDATGQAIEADPDNALIAPYWEIDGKIRIGQQHYYEIDAQLTLTEPLASLGLDNNGSTDNALTSFPLKAHQRTRLNEINYLDHPLFGTLIQIIPYKEK